MQRLMSSWRLAYFDDIIEKDQARSYKTFFMLTSPQHEIVNAHNYKNIKKLSFFQAQISLECYFSCS